MPDSPEETPTATGDDAGAGSTGKKPTKAGVRAGSSAQVIHRAKTQRETDLEKRLSEMEDERSTLKESISGLEKWIEDFGKANKPAAKGGKPAAKADDDGWEEFSNNPW